MLDKLSLNLPLGLLSKWLCILKQKEVNGARSFENPSLSRFLSLDKVKLEVFNRAAAIRWGRN